MDLESESKLFSLITELLPPREDTMDADADEISDTDTDSDSESEGMPPLIQIISLLNSMDLKLQPKPETKMMSLVAQTVSVYNSMSLDCQPKPLLELISFIKQNLSLVNSTDSDLKQKRETELSSLFKETAILEPEPELLSLIYQTLSVAMSINSKCEKLISLSPQVQVKLKEGKFKVTKQVPWRGNNKWKCFNDSWKRIRFTGEEATHLRCENCNGVNHEEYGEGTAPVEIKHTLHPQHSLQLVLLKKSSDTRKCYCCDKHLKVIFYYCSACDFAINFACVEKPRVFAIDHANWYEQTLVLFPRKASLTCNLCALDDSASCHLHKPLSLGNSMDLDMELESKLFSLIAQLLPPSKDNTKAHADEISKPEVLPSIIKLISFVISMDLKSQPKPESELMSLVAQIVCVFNSMDFYSQPKLLSELIYFLAQNLSPVNSMDYDLKQKAESELMSLFSKVAYLEPEPELLSLIYQTLSLVMSMNSKRQKLISFSPQVQVESLEGKFHVAVPPPVKNKWQCFTKSCIKISFIGEEATLFFCECCSGLNHKGHEKVPAEITHTLHPQHSLQLVLWKNHADTGMCSRKCYCCDKVLKKILYHCSTCDFAILLHCVKNPPVLSINHTKWHQHPLVLFPRKVSLTCNLCGLDDSTSGHFYMCPPCDFVVHQSCLNLPRVIKISRHPHHRISFTPCFDRGEWSCAICRKKIDHLYGGYSCMRDGCSYVAHSRCATQSNIWDGEELEGMPEETEEEYVQPFVRISDGIIQHFSHQHHHLKLDENTSRDYDENKQCQACIMPIYFGNFYSCMQCDFILHESCANISRKIHHPIHPHQMTLIVGYDSVANTLQFCSACPLFCTAGFFYECGKEGCDFKLHVQCATISEPLIHGSHMHPLFLTSKPGEERRCSVCKWKSEGYKETFNCIECDFVMCFRCTTIPEKVRYKHDKHTLTLSYGKETSTMTNWCEACEEKIHPEAQYYYCDEYCCVNLHIACLIGVHYLMKTGSYLLRLAGKDPCTKVHILPNNMCRPICSFCEKRCPDKLVVQHSGLIFCDLYCLRNSTEPTTKVIK